MCLKKVRTYCNDCRKIGKRRNVTRNSPDNVRYSTVKVEQRVTLFYLANDVIQYSKRRNYPFVESWATALQKATPLVR